MSETFQEQMAQLRRKQISEAAIKVFAERGFHRTTIRDISKAAGVADGTIYNYFDNKAALLLGILDPLNEIEQHNTDTAPALITDVRQFFHQHFRQRLSAFEGDNLNVLRVVLSEALIDPELRALYVERILAPTFTLAEPYFQQLVAVGALRAMDVPLTLRTLTATFIGLLMLRLMGDPHTEAHWNDVPELLTTLLLDGMLPREEGSHDTL